MDAPNQPAPPAVDPVLTQSQDPTVLLQQMNGQIAALREEIIKLKPSKWIGVLQALLVAATVPLTAGVFSVYSERGNREIEIYKQNLALVDRAVDFEKDVRYRQAIISYMRELNGQRPDGYGIGGWLTKNEKELTARENELLVERGELTEASKRGADELSALTDELTSLREASDEAELTDDEVVEVAKKIETIELTTAKVEEAEEALSRVEQDLGGSAPAVKRTSPKVPPRAALQDRPPAGSLFIRVSTDRKLSQAEYEAAKVRKAGLDAQILFVSKRYVTVAGPYLDRAEARQDQESLRSVFKGMTMLEPATGLCPRYLPLKQAKGFVVVVCSPEVEQPRAQMPAPTGSSPRLVPFPR